MSDTAILSRSELEPQTTKLKYKILHGVYEIGNQMRTITASLNNLGANAKTLCYYPTYLKYKSDYIFDVSMIPSQQLAILRTRKYAEKLIADFDVFHFHFGTSLALDHSDLPILKRMGKKKTMHYWGSEVRMISKARELNKYALVKCGDEDIIKKSLDTVSNYIECCIVGDYELYEYVRDYFDDVRVIPQVIDLDTYRPSDDTKPNGKLLIVHAPTSPQIKGTRYIQQAIDNLQTKYDFEFQLVQGMSHEQAKTIYQQADLVIDQLHCGSYGLFAVEAMAMAKPVVAWITDFMKEKYPSEMPIISANPDNIETILENILNNREMLANIGRQGREYVEKYHDMRKVVYQFADLYRGL